VNASGRAVVATPWYPARDKPYAGAFVRDWVRALNWPGERLTVVHLEMVAPDDPRPAAERDTPEGRLVWTPVRVGHSLPRADAASAQARALRGPARAALEAADVVFAHVGLPTGLAAARAVRPDQRLVLAEHASYLPQVLRKPASRSLYGQVVSASDAVLTAGEETASRLRRAFPADRAKVWAVGNPVEPSDFPFRDRPADAPLDRWLYVGNLDAAKGVFAVVAGFAAYCAAHRRGGVRLALAGQGPARPALEDLARRLGVGDRVAFLGALDRSGVAEAMGASDLQLHLSPAETFGLAPLEGLLGGLPLVVARNHGTLQTVTPALDAHRAVMIDPPAGPGAGAAVARAVDDLAARLRRGAPGAALAVREGIARRYGAREFGAMERRVAEGLAPFAPAEAGAPPLVAAALTENGWGELRGLVGQALFDRRPVTAVLASRRVAQGLDVRVEATSAPDPAPWAPVAAKAIGRLATAPLKVWSLLARRAAPALGRGGGEGARALAERELRAAVWRGGLEARLRRRATGRRRGERFARFVRAARAARGPGAELAVPSSEGLAG
jgi:glycosyltransferase involved in cell wall biosynthesis